LLTRKATGLTGAFGELRRNIVKNINIIDEQEGPAYRLAKLIFIAESPTTPSLLLSRSTISERAIVSDGAIYEVEAVAVLSA